MDSPPSLGTRSADLNRLCRWSLFSVDITDPKKARVINDNLAFVVLRKYINAFGHFDAYIEVDLMNHIFTPNFLLLIILDSSE